MRRSSVAVLTMWLLLGCGEGVHKQAALPLLDESEPMGECHAVQRHYAGGSVTHRAECSELEYATNPPVFGDHYPSWAAYRSYDYPVPPGYLVHDLEHGAVVYFYDCPDGCADEVAEAEAMIQQLPDDPRCSSTVRVQTILVPRPGLGARWAASAWGYSLTADCFDRQVFERFYSDRHAQGPEDLCGDGTVVPEGACQ